MTEHIPFSYDWNNGKKKQPTAYFMSNSVHWIFIPNYSPLVLKFPKSMEKQKLYIFLMVLPTFSS